jgi:hypothetical protein
MVLHAALESFKSLMSAGEDGDGDIRHGTEASYLFPLVGRNIPFFFYPEGRC